MKHAYKIGGQPSASEYKGLWKYSPDDVTDGETFERQMESLEKWIENSGVIKLGTDVYHRGDFFHDWTHYIEIENPICLTIDLIELLQEWLKKPENSHARIAIPTNTDLGDEAVIMIYPTAVRLGREFEGNVSAALETIRSKMMRERDR